MDELIWFVKWIFGISYITYLLIYSEIFVDIRERIKGKLKFGIVSKNKLKKTTCQKLIYLLDCPICLSTWIVIIAVAVGLVEPWSILYTPLLVALILKSFK